MSRMNCGIFYSLESPTMFSIKPGVLALILPFHLQLHFPLGIPLLSKTFDLIPAVKNMTDKVFMTFSAASIQSIFVDLSSITSGLSFSYQ